tara:strand:- start:305 stop:1021 length:717 start_codon:yes stop_codon:yes gene_type:complete
MVKSSKKMQKIAPPESEEDTNEIEDIDIEAELEKARLRTKSRKKIDSEVDKMANTLKKERLAVKKQQTLTPEPAPITPAPPSTPIVDSEAPPETPKKRKGRFEKGSEEAKQWAAKMAEQKALKKQQQLEAEKKRIEQEEEYEQKLVAAQKAKIKALDKKLAKYEAQASKSASEDSEEEEVVVVKKKARGKKRGHVAEPLPVQDQSKTLAEDVIAKEKERLQKELMVQRMRSVIPNYPG